MRFSDGRIVSNGAARMQRRAPRFVMLAMSNRDVILRYHDDKAADAGTLVHVASISSVNKNHV